MAGTTIGFGDSFQWRKQTPSLHSRNLQLNRKWHIDTTDQWLFCNIGHLRAQKIPKRQKVKKKQLTWARLKLNISFSLVTLFSTISSWKSCSFFWANSNCALRSSASWAASIAYEGCMNNIILSPLISSETKRYHAQGIKWTCNFISVKLICSSED